MKITKKRLYESFDETRPFGQKICAGYIKYENPDDTWYNCYAYYYKDIAGHKTKMEMRSEITRRDIDDVKNCCLELIDDCNHDIMRSIKNV